MLYMLKNYFVSAFRNLVRNSGYALLNVIGLSVGMTLFLLIAQYVKFERSYEDFIPDRANIYRVSLETFVRKELRSASAENYAGLGPALLSTFPEVNSFARLMNMGYINNVVVTYEQAMGGPISLRQHRFLYADSSFLPMMGYEMISGNASQALAAPNTAVISETYARLYFGKEDPIGKTLHMHDDDSNDQLAKVTGVFKDLPANTHLKFDILFSYGTMFGASNGRAAQADQNWVRTRPQFYTYIRLRPGTDPKFIESRLPALYNAHEPQLPEESKSQTGHLQPLTGIHLRSDLAEEFEANGNGNIVIILGLVGVFILGIAWINFINLSTANAIGRAKEVGVRKVIGASRAHLIARFLAESALINGISLLIAYGMINLLLPGFNQISGLSLDGSYLLQGWFLGLLGVLWVAGSLLSGFYPAWVLSSFRPVTVLKGKLKNTSGGILLRKGLVVTQFMASIALIAGTIIVYRQVHYMLRQNIGMNIDQVLVMDRPGIVPNHDKNIGAFRAGIDLFRNELKKDPSIEAVSNSTTIPGKQREYKTTIKVLGTSSNDSITVRINSMDFDFLKVFQMQLLAGRPFSKNFPKDPDTSAIITLSAARLLGFKRPEDAIGKSIQAWDNYNLIIVGVVNDYHQVSLKKPLEPTLFSCDWYDGDYLSVRLHTTHIAPTLKHVEASWAKAFPGSPFEYFFLDDYFNRQYSNERQFGQLFTVLAMFAILISCLGLFGLSAYTASQRIKEIGIRKVLGASVLNITMMLSKDFLKLVVLAIVLVTPLVWVLMNRWLQGYAYRITISSWIFILAGLAALCIALFTVSFQAIKAAVVNPVESLRAE